jgi:hypothetical protein
MEGGSCDTEVGTLAVRTGEAPTTDEKVQERRQRGQSSGVRGLRRRWIMVHMTFAFEWEG